MTRTITIIALTCFLIVGAAATSILGGAGISVGPSEVASPVAQGPVTNKESKRDRLAVVAAALASYEPPQTVVASREPPQTVAAPGEPLRQAYASATPEIDAPKIITAPEAAPPKPKAAIKPAVQKAYALLSDGQIAGIKERLKLSASQESDWPAVENALRAVARKIHATRQAESNATPIDPEAEEVQQLKSAAMPLLFQLREDQKREVRALARLIGLEKVASMI